MAARSPIRNVALAYCWGIYVCYLVCCFAVSDGSRMLGFRVLLLVNTIVRGQLSQLHNLYDSPLELDTCLFI